MVSRARFPLLVTGWWFCTRMLFIKPSRFGVVLVDNHMSRKGIWRRLQAKRYLSKNSTILSPVFRTNRQWASQQIRLLWCKAAEDDGPLIELLKYSISTSISRSPRSFLLRNSNMLLRVCALLSCTLKTFPLMTRRVWECDFNCDSPFPSPWLHGPGQVL